MLGSVLIGKPILVMLIKSGYKDKSSEQRALIEQSLQSPALHSRFLLLTTIWGIGLFLTLVISVFLSYALPIAQVILIRPLIDYGIIVVLLAISIAYGRILRAKKY